MRLIVVARDDVSSRDSPALPVHTRLRHKLRAGFYGLENAMSMLHDILPLIFLLHRLHFVICRL